MILYITEQKHIEQQLKEKSMKELIAALQAYIVAEGVEDGRKVYHFLLPNGDVVEVVD